MKYNKKQVGIRINKIRKEKGMTLEEFGKLFGASKSSVLGWENGRTLPNPERLKQIAKIADMSVIELLEGNQINPDTLELMLTSGSFHKEFLPKLENFIQSILDHEIYTLDINLTLYFSKLYGRFKLLPLHATKNNSDEVAIQQKINTGLALEFEKVLLQTLTNSKENNALFTDAYKTPFAKTYIVKTTVNFMNGDENSNSAFFELLILVAERYSKNFPSIIKFILNNKISVLSYDINRLLESDKNELSILSSSGIFKNKDDLIDTIDFDDYEHIQRTLNDLITYIEANIGNN